MAPVEQETDLDYDTKALYEIFQHHKKSSLDWSSIRHQLSAVNKRIGHDRATAAMGFLQKEKLIIKVSHGHWRLAPPPARPSPKVIASAPATTQEIQLICARFDNPVTDSIYSYLWELLPKSATLKQICEFLTMTNPSDMVKVSNALISLRKARWVAHESVKGLQRGRAYVYTALRIQGAANDSAPKLTLVSTPQVPPTPTPTPISVEAKYTADDLKRYHNLVIKRQEIMALLHDINEKLKVYEE